jgi:pre-mRNA-splicing factor SYF2
VDRLVKDLQQAEEARLKKQRDRNRQNGEDGDVTYINDKNKQFNQKLSRFYNKVSSHFPSFQTVC